MGLGHLSTRIENFLRNILSITLHEHQRILTSSEANEIIFFKILNPDSPKIQCNFPLIEKETIKM